MSKVTKAVAVGLVVAAVCFAQQGLGRRRRDMPEPPEGRGAAILIEESGFTPHSIRDLVEHSDLVIDCYVESVLPSRRSDPKNPHSSLETDAVISVGKVLKGMGSTPVQRLIVSEGGGALGELRMVPDKAPMLQLRERYVLFLIRDNRPSLPVVAGYPRFVTSGVWHGKFAVTKEGSVSTSKYSALRNYDGQGVDKLLGDIQSAVAAGLKCVGFGCGTGKP